ncbi:MATE family efflux transporter [Paenibacillus tepidiphilus]|uniref:MATE family efflux transporter n=1 Tax=Paenibacillus tepidiphilus TaxID=2608683 RepID=UPI00123A4077|nr:MATE family efflux transporter [Paenibacillus tepidiphilus]
MDQTAASEPVSYRNIIRITYPIILSMFSINIMVFIDRAFVARYDTTQFAAVMPASNVATSLASIFLGVVGFSSTLISHHYGAGDRKSSSRTLWQGIYISLLSTLGLLAISPLVAQIFSLMGHGGELLAYEKQFFYLMILSNSVQIMIAACSSLFRGVGDTKKILYVSVIANLCNILLDWLLIFGNWGFPELGGIKGAGLATLFSCLLNLLLTVLLLCTPAYKKGFEVFKHWKPDLAPFKKIWKFGLPSGIQSFVGTAYFSLLLLILGGTGENDLTAANIVFTIEGLSIFPIWGLGNALSIVAAQERGGGRTDNISGVLRKGLWLALGFNVLIIAVFNLLPGPLISIFHDPSSPGYQAVLDITIPLVRLTSVWIIFDSVQIVIGSILKAAGDTLFMMKLYLLMPIVFYLVLPYLTYTVAGYSLYWVWLELLAFTLAMLLFVGKRYLDGKWRQIEVLKPPSVSA